MCLQLLSQLPLELQHEIILWLKDEPDVRRYASIASRFYTWLVVGNIHI